MELKSILAFIATLCYLLWCVAPFVIGVAILVHPGLAKPEITNVLLFLILWAIVFNFSSHD